jgi:hypothetical protein
MFKPTPELAKLKQRFWRRVKAQNTVSEPSKMSLMAIARLCGSQTLAPLLSDPETYDWFLDEKFEEDLIKGASEDAIQALINIATGVQETKSAQAQVSAAKILLDIAGYSAKPTKEIVYKDEDIGKMSEAELKEFIKQRSVND